MAYDWFDLDRTDLLDFVMVSPQNINVELGTLEGVDRSSSSLSAAYYTDTRTSGTLTYVGDGWIRGSFIRIIHRIPEWGYTNELGTYIVTEDPGTRSNGAWTRKLTLHSALHGLKTDLGANPWVIKNGAYAKQALTSMLDICRRPYMDKSARDARFTSPVVYETGTSYLARIYDIAKFSNNRIDVDGHGRVTLSPYIEPALKSASFRIDLSDTMGVAQDGLEFNSNWLEMPGRAVVSYRYYETQGNESVEKEITASVDATGAQSSYSKGYMITDYQQLSAMEPATYAKAQQLAKARLSAKNREQTEWKVKCCYLPIWEGSIVELRVPDAPSGYTGDRHCLVKNVELDLMHMTMKLTLKETSGGDDEDD